MAAPDLTHTARRLYEALAPLATEDADHGYALALYCAALARLLDEVADLSRDVDDTRPGWTDVLDPDACPEGWLPWLAQFVGVRLPDGASAATKRERIKSRDGFRRGTPAAMKAAARAHLTGSRTVFLVEQHGSPYRATVTTYTSETPDAAAVEAAVLEQKPAGIVLTHSVVPGGDFDTLRDTHSDFDEVAAVFASFDEVRDDPAKQ